MADELNFQLPEKGFDSYLAGIIPDDQAVLAGAFSVAMQQIRNIERVPAQEFARVVYNNETNINLPLTNGTDVPTNLPLQSVAKTKEALGSGVNGQYTMSNFFGAMSGLPYPWKLLTESIKNLQTQKLINIYQEMFLGTTWEYAEVRITQPYWSTTTRGFEGSIAQPYEDPVVSRNSDNPDYQPDPAEPDYDPFPYLNGSSGAKTYSEFYYSAGGQPAIWDWYYKIGSLTLTEDGGGYGRGTASNPNVYVAIRTGRSGRSSADTSLNVPCVNGLDGYCSPTGARATAPVGRNPQDCASVGRKSYGRVSLTANLGSPYAWRTGDSQATINWVDLTGQDTLDNPPRTPILYAGYPEQSTNPRDQAFVNANIPRETVEIQDPPIEMLPVLDTGKNPNGANTNGRVFADPFMFGSLGNLNPWEPGAPGLQAYGTIFWPDPGNAVVQGYIDQANTEIQAIKTRNGQNFQASTQLNALWDITAIALKHEQRARYIGVAPVPIPWDSRYAEIPTALNTFVDSIPEYAQQTAPHMAVQTLEHISNTDTTGGQSIIAMMRQERNQNRLAEVGIQLDNNMPTKITPQQEQRLMLNGTLPGAVEGVPGGVIPGIGGIGNTIYTIPAWPENTKPITYWDCAENQLKQITNLKNGTLIPILAGEGCPIVNPEVPTGPGTGLKPSPNIFENDNDSGSNPNGTFPPANVNSNFTGTTLKPSTYDVGDAIDKVIECNCDCWID
jgi:hypothetical protein